MTPSSRARSGPRTLLLLGALALLAALALAILHGLLLMAYEDQAGTADWTPATLAAWRATLSPEWRAAYWLSALGAPIALVAGGALVGLGVWRRRNR